MATIVGFQVVYRLQTSVRVLIDHRDGVDSFKLYWSATEGGAYTEFADVPNQFSNDPASRGKIMHMFFPADEGMDNSARNYIKLEPITNEVPGVQEGPTTLYTREETNQPVDKRVMTGFSSDLQKYIPVAVDEEGKIITS